MTGVINGGWEYVTAAYAATWLFFLGYTASLFLRQRELRATPPSPAREDSP